METSDRNEADRLDGALRALRDQVDRTLSSRNRGIEVEWLPLFEELRARIGSLGMHDRSGEVDAFGLDEIVVRRSRPILRFLRSRYWRVEVEGLSRVPETGPVLFVANRSGLLPYDGLMITQIIEDERPALGRPRFLVADWLITLPFAQPYLARLGGVRACRENATRLLESGHSLVAFPEGAKGATKSFRDRYRLQRFGRGGVVRLAQEVGVPIVPVAVVGAEEAHPILFKSELSGRVIGFPFLPVTPTFPALGLAGLVPLPSKWRIEFGEALAPDAEREAPDAAELQLAQRNERLRAQIQEMVDRGVRSRQSVFS